MEMPECFDLTDDLKEALDKLHKTAKARGAGCITILVGNPAAKGSPCMVDSIGLPRMRAIETLWQVTLELIDELKKTFGDAVIGSLEELLELVVTAELSKDQPATTPEAENDLRQQEE